MNSALYRNLLSKPKQSTNKYGVTDEFLQLYEEAFELYDKEGNGRIDDRELKHLLRCFEKEYDEEDIEKFVKENEDPEHLGSLSFESILNILKPEDDIKKP